MADLTANICKIVGCGGKVDSHGLCSMHRHRLQRHGNPGEAGRRVRESEKHGMSGTKLYHVWQTMIQRCCNPQDKSYRWYGGRGITIYNEWRFSFLTFFHDMGNPPSQRHQLDRADNSKGYFKANCRWLLPEGNSRNRSSTKLNPDAIVEIRRRSKKGAGPTKIAKAFRVDPSMIGHILLGRNWKGVGV